MGLKGGEEKVVSAKEVMTLINLRYLTIGKPELEKERLTIINWIKSKI